MTDEKMQIKQNKKTKKIFLHHQNYHKKYTQIKTATTAQNRYFDKIRKDSQTPHLPQQQKNIVRFANDPNL